MSHYRILYNGRCPICSAEVAHYARRAEATGAALIFEDLHQIDLTEWQLSPEAATRRIHAMSPDGRIISGFGCFPLIWAELPGWRWLARIVQLPGIGPILDALYNRFAAPLLYRMHLRREALAERRPDP